MDLRKFVSAALLVASIFWIPAGVDASSIKISKSGLALYPSSWILYLRHPSGSTTGGGGGGTTTGGTTGGGLPPPPSHPLDAWLQGHQNISSHLKFQMPPGNINLAWKDWSENQKSDLRNTYDAYITWHAAGSPAPFPGTEFPDPIPNAVAFQDNQGTFLAMDQATAWSVYISNVAFSLAGEINNWYGWSLVNDANEDLDNQFSSFKLFLYKGIANQPFDGYFKTDITPAPPSKVYLYLKDNGLIQPTQIDTIGSLLGWMRAGYHIVGSSAALNMEYTWGYRGPPPISRILNGTTLTDPAWQNYIPYQGVHHWIQACYGSTYFQQDVLRLLNIPVRIHTAHPDCPHYTPYYPTIGMYLSHADDPYSDAGKAPPDYPGKDLLVDEPTFNAWFPPADGPTACANVGRRPYELAMQRLPDPLVDKYCQDKAAGKPHETGAVLAYFSAYYDLQELEAFDLWTKLSTKAQGKCP